MARRPTELGSTGEQILAAGVARRATAVQVIADLKAAGITGVSRATIGRRLLDGRGKVAPPRMKRGKSASPASTTAAEDAPPLELPDVIPPGTAPEQIESMISNALVSGEEARKKGDLASFAAMGRFVVMAKSELRKATPPPKPDPNDNPDIKAAKERVRREFHKLIDKVAPP